MKNETGRSAKPKLKVGEMLVQDGLVTADQLPAALAAQNKQPIYMPLGEICVDMKLISREQLKKLLSKHQKRIPLGELLTNLGLVSAEQVQGCLKEQKSSSKKLGEILIGKGFLNENALISALNMQLGVPKMTPHASLIDKTLFNDINEAFLRRNNAIPAYKRGNELTVIMADPLDTAPIRDLETFFKCEIHPAIAAAHEIHSAISQCLNPEFRAGNSQADKDLVIETSYKDTSADAKDPAAVDILNYIIPDAVRESASDIHIEAQEKGLRIRYRVDG